MPSKALLRSGHLLHEAQAMPGVPVGDDAQLDVDAVLARRDSFAARWDDAGQAD